MLFAAGSPDDAELRANRANHLLHWSIMRWAAAAGFEGYDLGGVDTHAFPGLPEDSSHPLWNLYEFKRRLGAVGEVRIGPTSTPQARSRARSGGSPDASDERPSRALPPRPGEPATGSPRHDAWQPRRTLQPAREVAAGDAVLAGDPT